MRRNMHEESALHAIAVALDAGGVLEQEETLSPEAEMQALQRFRLYQLLTGPPFLAHHLMDLEKEPFEDLRSAVFHVLRSLASQPWGREVDGGL